jgi:putative transcriptional regulator
MSSITFKRLSFIAVAMVAIVVSAALSAPPAASQRSSLAGQLLIAAPNMGDPRFYQTVVLLVLHDRNGAMGIVVNRPLDQRPLASLLEALGETTTGIVGSVRIFAGGPVQPELGFVLHSADYHKPETVVIDGHLAMTSSREILRDIANGGGPKQSLVAFGYAGWGPGQLEGELAQRLWFTTPADANLVFEEARDRLWENAMTRRTQDL